MIYGKKDITLGKNAFTGGGGGGGRSMCNENSPVNPKVFYLHTS